MQGRPGGSLPWPVGTAVFLLIRHCRGRTRLGAYLSEGLGSDANAWGWERATDFCRS